MTALTMDCTPDVKNAMNVSYLEHLYFEGGRKWAFEALPPLLKQGWRDMMQYLDDLAEKGRKD